jgi:hypothetical protein
MCFVFCVHFQSPEMSYASVAMTCAGPIGGGQCPTGHRVYAKSKYDPKIWKTDKNEGGNVVWRHLNCRHSSRQRHPVSLDPASSAVASSPMYARLYFLLSCSVPLVVHCPVSRPSRTLCVDATGRRAVAWRRRLLRCPPWPMRPRPARPQLNGCGVNITPVGRVLPSFGSRQQRLYG